MLRAGCSLFEKFGMYLSYLTSRQALEHSPTYPPWWCTGKNNRFPLLDILGHLKNTHKNPKFGKVRQVQTREFPTKFPDWGLSHSSKFGIFVSIL